MKSKTSMSFIFMKVTSFYAIEKINFKTKTQAVSYAVYTHAVQEYMSGTLLMPWDVDRKILN